MMMFAMLLAGSAFAAPAVQAPAADPYFTLKTVKIRRLETPGLQAEAKAVPVAPFADDGDDGGTLGDVNEVHAILDQIINMGKEVWTIVESNKPVVNVSTTTANALPEGVRGWQDLAGWDMPRSQAYQVSYENGFGMDVVDFKFRVIYTSGGNVNGVGRYLTNVTIVPDDVSVSWGYTFNASNSVVGLTNAGTSADPMAAMQLQLTWSVDTVIKHDGSNASFYVRGDGTLVDLGGTD
jgi:hypothetical protein